MLHVDMLDAFHFSSIHPASYRKQNAKNSLYMKAILIYYQEIGRPLTFSKLCYIHTAQNNKII